MLSAHSGGSAVPVPVTDGRKGQALSCLATRNTPWPAAERGTGTQAASEPSQAITATDVVHTDTSVTNFN